MIPVVTPDEMAAIDAAAPEPSTTLIARAGAAVARAAIDEMGGCIGRRVVVLAGPGSNGADGRVAARRLALRGARTTVVDAPEVGDRLPDADLVIDAAYGTGLRRRWMAPATESPVLAVDLPSGVDPLTGCAIGRPLPAERTVALAALKPGLLLGEGRRLAGRVEVVDIGLDVSAATAWLVTDDDISQMVPSRPVDAHKWQSACWVVAGSSGMEGAAVLAATAAQRAGAGYVRLSVPGGRASDGPPEAVGWPLDSNFTVEPGEVARFASMVVGPGLGPSEEVAVGVRRIVADTSVPMVVDGDGLKALGNGMQCRDRVFPVVLTPHDGEFESLTGGRPGPDRLRAARSGAAATGAVILLKGPTTVVSAPDGQTLVVNSGDQRLATAGSGDVLAGIVGAFLARGADPLCAAAAGAHVHGRLLDSLAPTGVVAGDLAPRLVETLVALGVDRPLGVGA